MATTLPRISITITREQMDLLGRLSRFQGRPVSSYISELVDAATPAISASVTLLDALEAAEQEKPQLVADAASKLLGALSEPDPDQLTMFGPPLPGTPSAGVPFRRRGAAGRADRSESDARTPAPPAARKGPRRTRGRQA